MGIDASNFQRDITTISFFKPVIELHAWIENDAHVIKSPNVKASLFVKIVGTLLKKQKHLLQILIQEMHNDMILPIYEGGFFMKNS